VRWVFLLGVLACGARTPLGEPEEVDAAIADVAVRDVTPHDVGVMRDVTPPPVDAPTPCSRPDISGTLRVTTDDQFILYVNGALIDANPHMWNDAQTYTITIHRDPMLKNTIAIQGTNLYNIDGRDRGILADLRFMTEAGEQIVVTRSDWKLSTANIPNWTLPSFDDSAWSNAVDEGPYPIAPWGFVFGVNSTADWIWSYDSNKSSGSKPMVEPIYVRRSFYVDASGHLANAPSACK
jgi:hypothetical protein